MGKWKSYIFLKVWPTATNRKRCNVPDKMQLNLVLNQIQCVLVPYKMQRSPVKQGYHIQLLSLYCHVSHCHICSRFPSWLAHARCLQWSQQWCLQWSHCQQLCLQLSQLASSCWHWQGWCLQHCLTLAVPLPPEMKREIQSSTLLHHDNKLEQTMCQWIQIYWADNFLSIFATWNEHKARIVFSGKVYSLDPFSGEEREPLGVCSLRYEKQFWGRNRLILFVLTGTSSCDDADTKWNTL